MVAARSDDQKLQLLAQLEFNPDAELCIHDGGWEIDKSSIYKLFAKRSYIDFSQSDHFDAVEELFKRKLEKCSTGDFANSAIAGSILNALRGLSYHLAYRYGSRKAPFPRKGKTLLKDAAGMIAKRFAGIEDRVHRFAAASVVTQFTTRFGQRAFIADDSILNGGVCFGITTHWCLRYLLRNKDSYAVSKKSEESATIVDPKPKTVSDRMAKKAPMIFHLQNRQQAATKLEEGKSVGVVDLIWDKVENKGYNSNRINNLNTLYYDRAGYLPENCYGTVQNYINMKSLGHSAANIKKLREITLGNGAFAAFCYSVPDDARILREGVRQVFAEMSPSSSSAYIVSFRLGMSDQDKLLGTSCPAPYFILEGGGGHAMGVITDGKGSWTFMDPNFGELNRKSKGEALELFALLMSMYAITCNLRKFVVLEVVKSADSEFDPKHAFIF